MEYNKLLSFQPFWELHKSNEYILLDTNNKIPIATFYEFDFIGANLCELHSIPGIGMISIMFNLAAQNIPPVCFGVLSESQITPLFGMTKVFGCHFFPGEFTRIFAIPSNEIPPTGVYLDNILSIGSLAREISEKGSFIERVEHMTSFIYDWENKTHLMTKQRLTRALFHNILLQKGNLRMQELSDSTGYCPRYIQKMMIEQVGLPPKAALNNIKFQSSLHLMMSSPQISVIEVAQRCGYYDQAHYTKTFKKNMGVTPHIFLDEIRSSIWKPKSLSPLYKSDDIDI